MVTTRPSSSKVIENSPLSKRDIEEKRATEKASREQRALARRKVKEEEEVQELVPVLTEKERPGPAVGEAVKKKPEEKEKGSSPSRIKIPEAPAALEDLTAQEKRDLLRGWLVLFSI